MAEEIINYIKENLAKGLTQDQIRQSLLNSGWKQTDIEAAFLQLDAPPSSLPPFPIKPPPAQNPPLKPKIQKPFFNKKILVVIPIIMLLVTVGLFIYSKKKPINIWLNKTTAISLGEEKIDETMPIGTLQDCFNDLEARKKNLLQKDIYNNYKNVGTFHPSPEALDTSANAPVRESGKVKDSLYARYYFVSGNNTDTILNVNVAEFESKVDLQKIFNTLHDLQLQKDSKFINFYFKYIEGRFVYFVEQTLYGEQILPGGSVEKQESQQVDIYLQVSERNTRVHFNFLGSSLNNRRISMEEAEMVFKDWLNAACNVKFELVLPNF